MKRNDDGEVNAVTGVWGNSYSNKSGERGLGTAGLPLQNTETNIAGGVGSTENVFKNILRAGDTAWWLRTLPDLPESQS